MLQNLLADGFKLKIMIARRTVAGFDPTVDKKGLKNFPPGVPAVPGRLGGGIAGRTMAGFTRSLKPNAEGYSCDCGSTYLPVVDKTGLTGSPEAFSLIKGICLATSNFKQHPVGAVIGASRLDIAFA